MSITTKAHKFAQKYQKKFGGNLCLEKAYSARDYLDHPDLPSIDVPEKVVTLSGYVEYNSAKARKLGVEGRNVRTGYVVGLAVSDGQLYAITSDTVYRLYGPWMAEVITENNFLNSLWQEVKEKVMAEAKKKSLRNT